MADAAVEFQALATALREAGEMGLRRELYKAISDAAQPLAREIRDPAHLKPYMPDRYALVLAGDLAMRVSKRTGTDPGVRLTGKGRVRNRHVERIEQGILRHPVYGNREAWVSQSIRPGFFADPVAASGPAVRQQIEAAVKRVIRKIYAA